ncbi:MAG TPA: hypothetical protein VMZ11_02820 [Mycobacteriales bacterium]|nr:hypothetical protein [Mycobacteriales bacterium]
MTAVRVVCARCSAPFDPSLTLHRCPVCDTAAPGPALAPRVWDDPDDRLLAIVTAATLANVLLLAVLALVVLS